MKRFFFSIAILLISFQTFSQKNVDSLKTVLKNTTILEEKIQTEILLAEAYLDLNLDTSQTYLDAIKSKLNKQHAIELHIRYHIAKSILYRIKGDFPSGTEEAFKALAFTKDSPDSLMYKSKIYNSLGSIADGQSNILKAIEFHLKALRYAESINFEKQIATICNGLGRAYLYLPDVEKARMYFERVISIKEKRNEYDEHLARGYLNMSNCLDAEGKYNESLVYLDKSILLKTKFKSIDLTTDYNNKAYTLLGLKRLNEAEISVKRSITLADSLGLAIDRMYAYSTYAEILFAQNRIQEAQKFMEQSIDLSKANNDLYLAKYNLDLMYNIFLKKKDYQKALIYYKARTQVLDSVNSIRSKKVVEKLALEYDTEKKDKEIELLNNYNEIKEIKLKQSNQFKYAYLTIALLSIIVVLLLMLQYRNKIKTDAIIKESMKQSFDKQITNSELQTLRSQMNPHFLFNSLNSINSFIIKNNKEKASEYLTKFSQLIRRVLNNSKEPRITLSNELEALILYIEMEAIRFENSFTYNVNIDPNVEVDYIEIPPLIIQPYVENSIWHGLMHKKDGVRNIDVNVQQNSNILLVTIEDNGIGREASQLYKSKNKEKHKSFGMNITKERLDHINKKYGIQTNINIEDLKDEEGNALGTRVNIKIGL